MKDDQADYTILWEAPKIEPPEFRLYYDDTGKVVTYTCEKLDGNFIIIDAMTFAEARPDVRVIDERLIRAVSCSVVSKLVKDKKEGLTCAADDVSIIIDNADSTGNIIKQKWKLETYEII